MAVKLPTWAHLGRFLLTIVPLHTGLINASFSLTESTYNPIFSLSLGTRTKLLHHSDILFNS